MSDAKKKHVRDIYLPNSTPVPNYVFDELLQLRGIPGSTLRVLLFLIRKTVGWNKKSEYISLTDIMEGARVDRHAAADGIKSILAWGLFSRVSGKATRDKSLYTINLSVTLEVLVDKLMAFEEEGKEFAVTRIRKT